MSTIVRAALAWVCAATVAQAAPAPVEVEAPREALEVDASMEALESTYVGPPRTTLLPADGGELGQAFADLVEAYHLKDAKRAAKRVPYPEQELRPDRMFNYWESLHPLQPAGGKRQGKRATLFLSGPDERHAVMSATLEAQGWRFDEVAATATRGDERAEHDCAARPLFPCATATAPDARVAGTLKAYEKSATYDAPPPVRALFDGFATRMLDGAGKLAYTRVVVSAVGFEPGAINASYGFDGFDWKSYQPVLVLDIPPDGARPRLRYVRESSSPWFARVPVVTLAQGLQLDPAPPGRIRGKLKVDLEGQAAIDVAFDLGTASECPAATSRCDE